ncbi:MAG: ThuA domain-containing protein [Gemmataceae bacterium]|nr:ThuA domain-containing protein [Gemmataceae bacterium]
MRFLTGLVLMMMAGVATAADPWVTYPGPGKKVVLISGDEEYRSEETLTQLGRILSRRHGYHCTVHFAIDPKTGTIDPNVRTNIPGLEALESADLMVIFTRFRNLSDDQMQHIVAYVDSGRPIIGMRTATHGFAIKPGRIYSRFGDGSREWPGGFGKQVLGEKWVSHHGDHGKEGTRGRLAPGAAGHPILRGIADGAIFGTSDVYTVNLPLAGDALVLGEVTETLDPASKAVAGKKNDPMMPIAWTRTYTPPGKSPARVFATTLGASQDFASAGTRRLLVNAVYWAVGDEAKIPAESDVELVGEFTPSPFRTDGFKKGVTPESLKLPDDR